jgi:hypothetical protein
VSERTAACPNCGAEIVFRWSGAVQTTCPACRSILVRHDLDLERVGTVGDVPPSMSRIQLGTEGAYERVPFVVVGRIIYEWERGHWSEWHLRMSDGSSAWLSDAQAEYAVTRQIDNPGALPPAGRYEPGLSIAMNGKRYAVSVITHALYSGVEGELPFEYWDKLQIEFVDLRSADGELATIDFSEMPPNVYVGKYVDFADLQLTNLRDDSFGGGQQARDVRGLNCPQCGAAIELRTGALAQTVACPACTAILDARDQNLSVVQAHQEKLKTAEPLIPLGASGTLDGASWQVIGFQVRGVIVEGVAYRWREYLLWNVERGFRYLTEYDGHWNDVIVLKSTPADVRQGEMVRQNGLKFKHFQSAEATTFFVLGEFPWEVRSGDQAEADDYVSPPLMLSCERTAEELSWSLGTYTSPARIAEAFKLETRLPRPRGVFANQPNPRMGGALGLRRVFAALTGILIVLAAMRFATARNEDVLMEQHRYSPSTGDTGAFVTKLFDLRGRASNVRLKIDTDLSNAWAYLNLALLADSGGTGYEFGREISNYAGVEDGESWHEGSAADKVIIPSVPPGRYYLRVEPERTPEIRPYSYTLTVTRDVPRLWPFLVALVLLVVPWILAGLRAVSFEYDRWKESDHPWSSSDDD